MGGRIGERERRSLAKDDRPSETRTGSNRNPLDRIERNLVLAPVVELRRAGGFVVGDVLRGFQRSAVLQVRRDTGGAKRVISYFRFDADQFSPSLDHAIGVLLP